MMEKSYKLLDYKEPMPVEEIERLFDGYWVYLVNTLYGSDGQLVSGIPVVCGDVCYAGAGDGIYNQFDTEEYGEHSELYLYKPGFVSALEIVRRTNA
jgi:hypothetical protein